MIIPQVLLLDQPRYVAQRHVQARIQKTAYDIDPSPSKLRKVILDRRTLDNGDIVFVLGTRFGGVVTRDEHEVPLDEIDSHVTNEELQRFENEKFRLELEAENMRKPLGRPRKYPDPLAGGFTTSGSRTPERDGVPVQKARGRPRKGLISAASSHAAPAKPKGPRGRPRKIPSANRPNGQSIVVEIPSKIQKRIDAVRSSLPPSRSETPLCKCSEAPADDYPDELNTEEVLKPQFHVKDSPNSILPTPSITAKSAKGPVKGTFLSSHPRAVLPEVSQPTPKVKNLSQRTPTQLPYGSPRDDRLPSQPGISKVAIRPSSVESGTSENQSPLVFRPPSRLTPYISRIHFDGQELQNSPPPALVNTSSEMSKEPPSSAHRRSKGASQPRNEKSGPNEHDSVSLIREFEKAVLNSTRPLHSKMGKQSSRRRDSQDFQMIEDLSAHYPTMAPHTKHNTSTETSRPQSKGSDAEEKDALSLLQRFEAPSRAQHRSIPSKKQWQSSRYPDPQDVEMIDLTSEDIQETLPSVKHKRSKDASQLDTKESTTKEIDAQALLRGRKPSARPPTHTHTQKPTEHFIQDRPSQSVQSSQPIPPAPLEYKAPPHSTSQHQPHSQIIDLEEQEEGEADVVSLLHQFQAPSNQPRQSALRPDRPQDFRPRQPRHEERMEGENAVALLKQFQPTTQPNENAPPPHQNPPQSSQPHRVHRRQPRYEEAQKGEEAVSLLRQFQAPAPRLHQNTTQSYQTPPGHQQKPLSPLETQRSFPHLTPSPRKASTQPSSPKNSPRKSMTPHYPRHHHRPVATTDFFVPRDQRDEQVGSKRKRGRERRVVVDEEMEEEEEAGRGREESIEL